MQRLLETRVAARAGSYLSRAAVAAGPLMDWYIGSEDPYFHKVPYYLAKNTADSLDPSCLAEFEGDPSAGWRRWNWEKTGVVLGRASTLDAFTEELTDMVRAVGWLWGDSILVGAVPHRKYERVNSDGFYEAGLRIGPMALTAAYGIWDQQLREFHVPPGASVQGPTYESYLDAPTGLLLM